MTEVIRQTGEALGVTVIGFLAVAGLAITTSSAQAAVLAREQAPAQPAGLSGVVAAALAEPRRTRADTPPARCPYDFGSAMPAATFCVYHGVARGSAGEVCATDVVVIWSSLASQAPGRAGAAETATQSNRDVYLGFVADPELVVLAIADPRHGGRADMVEYTLGSDAAPQPLAGEMTLRAVRLGSADVLGMDLYEPQRFHPASCAFASYSGTFLGVIGPPSDTTASVDRLDAPHQ